MNYFLQECEGGTNTDSSRTRERFFCQPYWFIFIVLSDYLQSAWKGIFFFNLMPKTKRFNRINVRYIRMWRSTSMSFQKAWRKLANFSPVSIIGIQVPACTIFMNVDVLGKRSQQSWYNCLADPETFFDSLDVGIIMNSCQIHTV